MVLRNSHFTASAVVLHEGCVLLVHHKRLNAWLPPGGHIEPGERPDEAAVRETLEETGVPVEVVSDTVPDTGSQESFILKQPLCLQQVKAFENGSLVYHIDVVYLCRTANDASAASCDVMPPVRSGGGVLQAQWMKQEQLQSVALAPNVIEVVEFAYSKCRCKKAALRA